MIKGIVIGNNIVVPKTDSEFKIFSLFRDDVEYTESDSGKAFIGENFQIDTSGNVSFRPSYDTRNGDFTADASIRTYFCDASEGNITVTLSDHNEHIFIKTDSSSNTVTLSPSSGSIRGTTSFALSNQYEGVTVISNGTDRFILRHP